MELKHPSKMTKTNDVVELSITLSEIQEIDILKTSDDKIFRTRTFQIPLPVRCERNLLCHQSIAFQEIQSGMDPPSHLDLVVLDHTP